MKKTLLFVVLLSAAVILTGCGRRLTDKALERAIEQETGGAADVDFNGDNWTATTDQGSVAVGANVGLPADFPTDVYVPDGQVITAVSDLQQNGVSATIQTTMSSSDVIEKYKSELVRQGWTITTTANYGGTMMIGAQKDQRTLAVSAMGGDGLTTVTIVQSAN